VASDGTSVYLAGGLSPTTNSDAFHSDEVYVASYAANGQPRWALSFGTGAGDAAFGMAVDGSSVYVVGITDGVFEGEDRHGDHDGFLARIDQ